MTSIVAWGWDFGDGTTSNTGPTVPHTFPAAGSYDVELTVTNNYGLKDTTTQTVVVSPPPPVMQIVGTFQDAALVSAVDACFYDNNHILVVCRNVIGGIGGIVVVDITNRTAPTIAGSLGGIGDALNVDYDSGGFAYVCGADFFASIDLANLASPSVEQQLSDSFLFDFAQVVLVEGSTAYVFANDDNEMNVGNVSNPAAMSFPVGTVADFGLGVCRSVVGKVGNYIYSGGAGDRFMRIDVSVPATPTITTFTDATNLSSAGVNGTVVRGSFAYVMPSDRLSVVDVSGTPAIASVLLAGGSFVPGRPEFVRSDYLAAAAGGSDRISLVDISDPLNPAPYSHISDATNLDQVQVCLYHPDDLIYAICFAGGRIAVIDL